MTSRDVCVDGFTKVKTDAVGESRGSAENGGERNGRRLGLASTETEIAQQVFTNGEERNGHGDADLDDDLLSEGGTTVVSGEARRL